MDYIAYALEYGLIMKAEDIDVFRYSCLRGINAVRKLFEHKNKERFPRILPLNNLQDFGDFLSKMENHSFDGEHVETLVCQTTKTLGTQKQLSEQINLLASRKRVLDVSGLFTLPAFTERDVSTLKISVNDLVAISSKLPTSCPQEPLKRADVENFANEDADVDDIISGLVAYSLI